jgi:hypothetical protein
LIQIIAGDPARAAAPARAILFALAIERLVVGVLLDQHHRWQAHSGAAARDRMEERRRLGDRLARPAAELLARVFGHEPLPRHRIERDESEGRELEPLRCRQPILIMI